MSTKIRSLAWKEMKETYRNYDRKNKASLIALVLFFTTLLAIQNFNPKESPDYGEQMVVAVLIMITVLYMICFDTLKRILEDKIKLNNELEKIRDKNRRSPV